MFELHSNRRTTRWSCLTLRRSVGHTEKITSLALRADGTQVVCASFDIISNRSATTKCVMCSRTIAKDTRYYGTLIAANASSHLHIPNGPVSSGRRVFLSSLCTTNAKILNAVEHSHSALRLTFHALLSFLFLPFPSPLKTSQITMHPETDEC